MIRFTDDIVIIAEKVVDLESILEIISTKLQNEFSITINKAKTKFLSVNIMKKAMSTNILEVR